MRKTDIRYQTYLKILEEELLPAMGCTEPIAVAYAAAMARDLLGSMPVRMEVNVSGNILKNVKSVVVPNTGGLRGIQAAAAAGAAVGQAERELEVIAQVTSEQVGEIRTFLERCPIQVGLAATSQIFYIEVLAFGGDGSHPTFALARSFPYQRLTGNEQTSGEHLRDGHAFGCWGGGRVRESQRLLTERG